MHNKTYNRTRIMAIDFGDARTGVAVSDESATLTGEAWVIHEKRQNILAKTIIEEAIARGVRIIVIGYPKNMDGTLGFRAKASEAFASVLRKLVADDVQSKLNLQTIDVLLWDERLTTKMADRILADAGKRGKKRKSSVDALAASLILESYIASL